MKLEIKNFKHNARMSEETVCFTADLYVNGTKTAFVQNHGHGGQTDFRQIYDKESFKAFEEYVNALPPRKSKYFPKGLKCTPDFIIDEMVDGIVNEETQKKELARFGRLSKKAFIIVNQQEWQEYLDGKVNQVRYKETGFKLKGKRSWVPFEKISPERVEAYRKDLLANHVDKGEIILNDQFDFKKGMWKNITIEVTDTTGKFESGKFQVA